MTKMDELHRMADELGPFPSILLASQSPERMIHVPWHCDDCGKRSDSMTWTPDGKWRCGACSKTG